MVLVVGRQVATKNILLATDFSRGSGAALSYAVSVPSTAHAPCG
jgi:hypothetical protein